MPEDSIPADLEQELNSLRGSASASDSKAKEMLDKSEGYLEGEQSISEEKKKRGRPKGSKNNKTIISPNAKVPSESTESGSAVETVESRTVLFKITPSVAKGYIAMINGMFIVMKLTPVSEEEKAGFIEVWSNIELPFNPDSAIMKYLPLISAGLFTLGLLMPRLSDMKKKRSVEQNKKQVQEKKEQEKHPEVIIAKDSTEEKAMQAKDKRKDSEVISELTSMVPPTEYKVI